LPTQQILHEVFRDHGLEPPRAALQTRMLSMRLRAATSSDLLVYGSKAIAEQFGALHVLPVEELRWVRSVGVLHRKEPYLSPAIRRFIEILKNVTPGSAAKSRRAS
jgi:DNA-binding transcriptional LysR family regulator